MHWPKKDWDKKYSGKKNCIPEQNVFNIFILDIYFFI